MRPVVILHSPPAICLSSGHIGHRLVLMLCNCWRATSLSRHVRPPRSFRSQPWLTEIALGSHRLEKNDKRLSPRTTLVDLGCGLCCVMPKSSFEDKKDGKRQSENQNWKPGRLVQVKTGREESQLQIWGFLQKGRYYLGCIVTHICSAIVSGMCWLVRCSLLLGMWVISFFSSLLLVFHFSPVSPCGERPCRENETK